MRERVRQTKGMIHIDVCSTSENLNGFQSWKNYQFEIVWLVLIFINSIFSNFQEDVMSHDTHSEKGCENNLSAFELHLWTREAVCHRLVLAEPAD